MCSFLTWNIIFTLCYFVFQAECAIKMNYKGEETDCNVPTTYLKDAAKSCASADCDLEIDSYDVEVDCQDDKNCTDFMNRRIKRKANICESFNVTLITSIDLMKKVVSVQVQPTSSQFYKCYKYYQVQLRKIEGGKKNCIGYDVLCYVHFVEKNAVLKFSNLNVGSYIIVVLPFEEMSEEQYKRAFCSNTIDITDSEAHLSENKVRNETPMNKKLLYIPTALTLLLIFFLVWFRKYKSRFPSNAYLPTVQLSSIIQEENNLLLNRNTDLLILHSSEVAIQEKVQLLKDYLENHAFFKVTLMKDVMHEILPNPNDWFRNQFHYKCSELGDNSNTNKRFLLVEPEKLLQMPGNEHVEIDVEDNFYLLALNMLRGDFSRCLKDYCHLFVVEFEESKERQFPQEFVPSKRYVIPEHLIPLCLNLSSFDHSRDENFQAVLTAALNSHQLMRI